MSESKRCKRITKISEELTDQTIKLYDEGKMPQFWDGVTSLRELLEVKVFTCGEHIE